MAKKKQANFIATYKWMLNSGLTGDEIVVLAYIHSFTEEGLEFFGSVQTVGKLIGRSTKTAWSILCRLVELGLLVKTGDDQKGRACHYSTSVNLTDLLPLQPVQKLHTPSVKSTDLPRQNLPTPSVKSTDNKNSYKNNLYKNTHNNRAFIPPTWNEVALFVSSRGWTDPEGFGHYYVDARTAGEWLDKSGNPITNWKSNIISSWEVNNKSKTFPQYHTQHQMTDAEIDAFLR